MALATEQRTVGVRQVGSLEVREDSGSNLENSGKFQIWVYLVGRILRCDGGLDTEGQEEELLFLIQKPGTMVLVPSQLCKLNQDI